MPQVLVVDDEPSLLRLFQFYLEVDIKAEVFTERDGKAALETFRSNRALDLVVLDLTLPDVSGVEVLEEILRYNPQTRVIICSALKPEHYPKELVSVAKAFLTKPFDRKTFVGQVRTVLAE